jgi:hypothetical protein
MAWLRLHTGLIDSLKVQALPDKLFRFLINLWCLARETGGSLPESDAIAWRFRMKRPAVDALLKDLHSRHLLDEDGGRYVPHDWQYHQYEFNASTERVRKFRERRKQSTETVSETQDETEMERVSSSVSVSVSVSDSVFPENNEKQKNGNPPHSSDRCFQEFIGVFLAFGVAMNGKDVDRCARIWAELSIEQQLAALLDAKEQAQSVWNHRATDKVPRPWNYLDREEWTRTRATPERKTTTKNDERLASIERAVDRVFHKGAS